MKPTIPLLELDLNPMCTLFPDVAKAQSARHARVVKECKKKNRAAKSHYRHFYRFPLTERRAKKRFTPRPPPKLDALEVPGIIELDDEENTLLNALTKQWMHKYQREDLSMNRFVSPTMFCLTKLFEMKNMTAHLVDKHPFRIAVICDLFAKLCTHKQFSILKPLQTEIFKILLADFSVHKSYTIYEYLKMHKLQMERNRNEDSEYLSALKIRDRKLQLELQENQERLVSKAHTLSPQIVSKMALYQNHWLRIQDRAQHTLAFVVFRVWRRFNQMQRHRMKIYPKLQIFESLHPGRNKVFKSWRRAAHYISMRKMQTELSDSHRTIAQLNVRNQNLQVEMVSLEKRSNDHIAQLTMELYHKNMDENTTQQFEELRRTLSVKWIRYLAQLNARILTKKKEELENLYSSEITDPYAIAYTLKIVANLWNNDLEFEMLTEENLGEIPIEDLLLNWVNYVLLSHKINSEMFAEMEQDNKQDQYDQYLSVKKRDHQRRGSRSATASVDIEESHSRSIVNRTNLSDHDQRGGGGGGGGLRGSNGDHEEHHLWKRSINNFSEDWRNGNAYLTLLVLLFDEELEQRHILSDLNELTPESKVKMVMTHLHKLGIDADRLLQEVDILDGNSNTNVLILSRLMLTNSKITGDHKRLRGVEEAIAILERTLNRANKLYKSRKGREVSDIMKFQMEVDGVLTEAAERLNEIEAYDRIWKERMQNVTDFTNQLLTHRLYRKLAIDRTIMVRDALSKGMDITLTNLIDTNNMRQNIPSLAASRSTENMDDESLRKVCEEQRDRIILLIQRFKPQIIKMFNFFVRITEKKKIQRRERSLSGSEFDDPSDPYIPRMRFSEFIGFLQLTRICDAKFTVNRICDIFTEEQDGGGLISYQSVEFSCPQFMAALIKVAKYKFVGQGRSQDLSHRVLLLLEGHLKNPVVNPFLNDVFQTLEVQSMLCQFESKLRRVYSVCINISVILRERLKQTEASRAMAKTVLDGNGLWKRYATVAGTAQVLIKDCSIQKEFPSINEKAIIRLMRQIQHFRTVKEERGGRQQHSAATDPFYQSVVFEEFLQLMVVLSMFAQPSPFLVRRAKIQNFLSVLKMRKTRKNTMRNNFDG